MGLENDDARRTGTRLLQPGRIAHQLQVLRRERQYSVVREEATVEPLNLLCAEEATFLVRHLSEELAQQLHGACGLIQQLRVLGEKTEEETVEEERHYRRVAASGVGTTAEDVGLRRVRPRKVWRQAAILAYVYTTTTKVAGLPTFVVDVCPLA